MRFHMILTGYLTIENQPSELTFTWRLPCGTLYLHRLSEYMQHVPCLNKAGQDIHRCVVKYLEDIRSIAEFIPKKDKAGFNCCRHYQFEDCVRKAVDTKCKNAAAKK